MTRERDTAAKLLAEEYGDPLEDILQKRDRWQEIFDEQMAKPSRRRNWKKIKDAEEMILRYNIEALPYMRPRYQAIAHTGDAAPQPMVIRAPETISESQAWLEKYGPKRDEAVNVAVVPFAKNLRVSLDTAEQLGISDPKEIVNEAVKRTKLDDNA